MVAITPKVASNHHILLITQLSPSAIVLNFLPPFDLYAKLLLDISKIEVFDGKNFKH